MHPYSIDTDERKIGIFILSLSSLGISFLISKGLNIFGISIPAYIDGPSTMAIFGFLYWAFEKYAWKWQVFRKLHLIKTPNLNGVWEGEYSSSYICKDTNKPYKGKVSFTIEQTWTRIRIVSENGKSISCSEVAGIAINDNMGIVLRYQYKNEPKFDTVESMHCHTGFNKLRYLPNKQQFLGDYFTDKNRLTYGTLFYEKLKE